ncbi:MAG TPA: hypothetical protein VL309_00765 [Vicinamibacterales bacterium]|nr:hypothetical protein [Vicinamibacterales bacterium]
MDARERPSILDSPRGGSAWAAAAAYGVVTLVLTWPLARGLAHDVPADFGDPLLNMWILAWSARHPLDWNAPIFHPHPLALAYSDHLTPQALLVGPVLAASGNPVLAYNVLFLSTFVLSALGAFLLARDLTGDSGAAFVAGLAFGFAPYRFAQLPHVQVLSSMWMPYAVLGFRRFLASGRIGALAGGAAAWLAQNLSCGYYLFFFSPALLGYVAWEAGVRRTWRDRRRTMALVCAAAAVALATLPFLLPYARLRHLGFAPRGIDEVQKFAADVHGFFTADSSLRWWGSRARAWPSPEGAVFPGVTIVFCALAGALGSRRPSSDRRQRLAVLAGWLAAAAALVSAGLLLGWPVRIPRADPILKITSLARALGVTTILAAGWIAASPSARRRLGAWLSSAPAPFAAMAVAAAVLSLGPAIHAQGRLVAAWAPYRLLYDFVPGFDGLRVPARFAMVTAFGLAVLAGLGAARLRRAHAGSHARAITAAIALALVAESWAVPIPINQNDTGYTRKGFAPLPARVLVGDETPPVYRAVAGLPPGRVILELPLGDPAFDVRDMFYAIGHRHALVNGYSGGAPEAYGLLTERLADLLTRPDRGWQAIHDSGANYVIVHEGIYPADIGPAISRLLLDRGAQPVASIGTDRIVRIQ